MADSASHTGNLSIGARTLSALEAKLHCLSRLNLSIPTQVVGRVGIAAGEIGIPQTGYAVIARVLPGHIPGVNRAAAGVADADAGSKAAVPLVANHINTIAGCRHTGGAAA